MSIPTVGDKIGEKTSLIKKSFLFFKSAKRDPTGRQTKGNSARIRFSFMRCGIQKMCKLLFLFFLAQQYFLGNV